MSFYLTNYSSPQVKPLIGLTFQRWTDSEYIDDLPGYHLTIEWYRGKWYGSGPITDESWILRGRPLCYYHSICFEFNWPRIWWR
jgi:hypothetical protein